MESRAELYARLNEQAKREVAGWPQWKKDGIVIYPRRGGWRNALTNARGQAAEAHGSAGDQKAFELMMVGGLLERSPAP